MSVIDTLITNRTGGSYNATDLNRVGAAIFYLQGRLYGVGISVTVTAKQDWTSNDVPGVSQMTTYLADVATIRGALAVPSGTPATPADMNCLTVAEANDIEAILQAIERLVFNIMAAFRHSGTFHSGQGGLRL